MITILIITISLYVWRKFTLDIISGSMASLIYTDTVLLTEYAHVGTTTNNMVMTTGGNKFRNYLKVETQRLPIISS